MDPIKNRYQLTIFIKCNTSIKLTRLFRRYYIPYVIINFYRREIIRSRRTGINRFVVFNITILGSKTRSLLHRCFCWLDTYHCLLVERISARTSSTTSILIIRIENRNKKIVITTTTPSPIHMKIADTICSLISIYNKRMPRLTCWSHRLSREKNRTI